MHRKIKREKKNKKQSYMQRLHFGFKRETLRLLQASERYRVEYKEQTPTFLSDSWLCNICEGLSLHSWSEPGLFSSVCFPERNKDVDESLLFCAASFRPLYPVSTEDGWISNNMVSVHFRGTTECRLTLTLLMNC